MSRLDGVIKSIMDLQGDLIFTRPGDMGAEEKEELEKRLAEARKALETAREQEETK